MGNVLPLFNGECSYPDYITVHQLVSALFPVHFIHFNASKLSYTTSCNYTCTQLVTSRLSYTTSCEQTFLHLLFQQVLHDWCNKGCGMCYPVCGMVHIKEPLLLIRMSSPCGGSGFSLSLSEWSFTICPMPYNRK